jgi:hypothetical protein
MDFVILTTGRTGSTWLCHLLDSHPQICCHVELLNATSPDPVAFHRSEMTDPLAFIAEVAAADPDRVVGFKLPWGGISQYPATLDLFADPTLKIIHVTRRDRLAQYFSIQRAERTGVFHTDHEQPHLPLALDPAAYRSWLHGAILGDAVLTAISRFRPLLIVDHSEIADPAAHDALQAFLGVPVLPLQQARVARIVSRPLAESVANWDAFAGALSSTEAAWTLAPHR